MIPIGLNTVLLLSENMGRKVPVVVDKKKKIISTYFSTVYPLSLSGKKVAAVGERSGKLKYIYVHRKRKCQAGVRLKRVNETHYKVEKK